MFRHVSVAFCLSIASISWVHAEESFCKTGQKILLQAAIETKNFDVAQRQRFEAFLYNKWQTPDPQERRRMNLLLPAEIDNMHAQPNGLPVPETDRKSIKRVLESCKAGDIISIYDPEHSNIAVSLLCDFGKSIVNLGNNIVCVLAPARKED